PAADLIVVSFQLHSVVYLALLKMNYKDTYVHKEAENEVNYIVKQRIMPMGGARLTEAVIMDLLEHNLQLVEKKYEMLAGDKINYLSERFLKCYTDLAPKKKFQILNKVITDINNRYENEPLKNRMDAKSKLREEFAEKNEFYINEIGDRIFGDDAEKRQIFDDRMERYDMQYDRFAVGKGNTVRGLEYITIETDTGVEIKIPIEEYITKENIEIVEEPGGGSTVIIRNIEQARVK
ncbi:nucleoid-associated protein, partial [Anaerostipes hominis (ex Lee et al. 2021)]